MQLNNLKPAPGSNKERRRVGRGTGSGLGKTCGKGHKGQKARAGGFKRLFEGGQMPLHMRLPKFGFTSRKAPLNVELRLDTLDRLGVDVIDVDILKNKGLIKARFNTIKVINTGKLSKAITLKGIKATAGAKAAILELGGKVE